MEAEFKTISYTSTLLWHFVRGRGVTNEDRAQSSFDLITSSENGTEILKEDAKGVLLCIPPGRSDHHPHIFLLEKEISHKSAGEDLNSETAFDLREPRSICFADIPINHLPIHINQYYGIGFGFRRDLLSSKTTDLKPVEYFPRNSQFTLNNACEKKIDHWELKKYAKVPSQDETFIKIYHEREWRTFENVNFGPSELALVFFPTRHILTKALANERFKLLFSKGVGFICGEDLYETSKES